MKTGNDKVWKFREGVLCSAMPEESLILDVKSGDYFRLNSTAADLSQCLIEGAKVEDLIAVLLADRLVSEETATTDALDFLHEIQSLGLIFESKGLQD